MLFRLLRLWNTALLRLFGGRHRTLSLPDESIELGYHVVGRPGGDPWLLLHGLGATAAAWAPVIRHLRRGGHLVVPALSVLGGTRCPGDALDLGTAPRALAALVEETFGRRPVTVAGISLGAWMAVLLAGERPDLVGRLVLIDAAGYRDQDWESIREVVTVETRDDVAPLLDALFARVPWPLRWSEGAFHRIYTAPVVRSILATTGEEHAYGAQDLARLSMPALVLWGAEDGLFPVAVAEATAEALPDARLEVLDGCGHVIQWECPAGVNRALERFRRERPLGSGSG